MKFSTNKKSLSAALQFVAGAVDGKSTAAILNNVLVKAFDDKLKLTATDLNIEKSIKIDAVVESEGSITVPQKKFSDVIKAIDSEKPVKFNLVDNKVKLTSGRSRFTIQTLPADNYPEFAADSEVETLELNADDLIDAMKRCSPMMGKKDFRSYLNGMLFDVTNEKLKVVSTDGHRLGVYDIPCNAGFENKVIVPQAAVNDILKMVSKADNASVEFGKNSIKVSVCDMVMNSKLVDGSYPDYNRVVPKELPNHIEMDREEFISAITRALTLANEKFHGVIMSFSNGEMTVSANNPQNENAEEIIKASYFDKQVDVGVNGNYILDAAKNITTETIILSIKDDSSSMRMDDDKFTAVVMPMRV